MSHFFPLLTWELRQAVRRPASYVLLGVLCLVAAGSFSWLLALLARGGGLTIGAGDDPVIQFLGPNVFLVGTVTLLVPLLTMNLVASERQRGTWDTWWTTHVRREEWLLARLTGAWIQYLLGLSPWLAYVLVLHLWNGQTTWIWGVIPWFAGTGIDADWGVTLGAVIGLGMLGLTFSAIGLFTSALCRTPLAAAFGTLAVLLTFLVASVALPVVEAANVDSRLVAAVKTFACWQHHEAFSQGQLPLPIVAGHLLVTATLVLTAASVLDDVRTGSRWSWRTHAGRAVILASCAALVFVIPSSVDLSRQRVHTLAPQTRQLLGSLKGPLEIVVMAPREPRTVEEHRFTPARKLVQQLAEQSRQINPAVRHRVIDAAGTEARSIQQAHPAAIAPCIIVRSGASTTVLRARDVLTYRLSGRTVEALEFHGEQALAAALARMADNASGRRIGFATGHGELAVDDAIQPASAVDGPSLQDRGPRITTADVVPATDIASLQHFTTRLGALGYTVANLDLRTGPIPPETRVLVIAGPREPWGQLERDRLRAWLWNGGRAFVLLEPIVNPVTGEPQPSGLEPLLEEFGVQVTRGDFPALASRVPSSHALIKSLPASPVAMLDPLGVAATREPGASPTTVTPLLTTSQGTSLAAAVERRQAPVLVAAGDAQFLEDRTVESSLGRSGFVFALAAIHWLQDRPELLGDVPARVHEPHHLSGTAADQRGLVWKPLALMLTLIATAGSVAWLQNRNG